MTEDLKLEQITPSPTNPRKTFDQVKLDDLAASIRGQGVLQPILVRVVAGRYELVLGERRFRASQMAELEVIPAVVREMTDQEVVEAQLVENQEREDVHPLEEADGYRMLIDRFGSTAEEVAVRLGKSKGYVYGRMKLCALEKAGRKAYLAGKLTAATALYVARLDPKLQPKAVEELCPRWLQGPMSAKDASDLIQSKYMLRLAGAPFNVKDGELLVGVPACGDCPKRTGAQSELFADVDSADVCTDPPCFAKKKNAAWKAKAAKYKARGIEVAKGRAGKAAIFESYGDTWSPGPAYVGASDKIEGDADSRTYKKVLGKPDLVVRRKNGKAAELFNRDGLKKRLTEAGVTSKVKGAPRQTNTEQSGRRPGGVPPYAISARVDLLLGAKVATASLDAPVMERLLWIVTDSLLERPDEIEQILTRVGLTPEGAETTSWGATRYPESSVIAALKSADAETLWNLVMQCHAPGGWTQAKSAFGVDFAKTRSALKKQATSELKAEAKVKAELEAKAEAATKEKTKKAKKKKAAEAKDSK